MKCSAQCLLILTFLCLSYLCSFAETLFETIHFYSAKCEYIAQTQVNLSGIIIVI